MKYIVKTKEEQTWTMWYMVEADSADEASEKYYEYGELYDDEFEGTDYKEILDVTPYKEQEKDSAIERLKQEGII